MKCNFVGGRYGFHRDRCVAALEKTDGDIGKSLEDLLTACFGLSGDCNENVAEGEGANGYSPLPRVEPDPDIMQAALFKRAEEKNALELIYEDMFTEKIPNSVWLMSLDLPELSEMLGKAAEAKKRLDELLPPVVDNTCRFYAKGNCRQGARCKFIHEKETPVKKKLTVPIPADEPHRPFELEVRFPPENIYPYELPLIAFSSASNSGLSVHANLCITALLHRKARLFLPQHDQVVFSLVGFLNESNSNEMVEVIRDGPLEFSLPEKKTFLPPPPAPPSVSIHVAALKTSMMPVSSSSKLPIDGCLIESLTSDPKDRQLVADIVANNAANDTTNDDSSSVGGESSSDADDAGEDDVAMRRQKYMMKKDSIQHWNLDLAHIRRLNHRLKRSFLRKRVCEIVKR